MRVTTALVSGRHDADASVRTARDPADFRQAGTRQLANAALVVSIILAIVAVLLAGGGALLRNSVLVTPRVVSIAELSDVKKVPDGLRVSVDAVVRPRTRMATTRGHAMIALEGAPAIIVSCDDGQVGCSAGGSLARTLTGEVLSADDTAVPIPAKQYSVNELHLDASRVRVLRLSDARGDHGGYIAMFVIAGLFALGALATLVRGIVLRSRV